MKYLIVFDRKLKRTAYIIYP